MNEYTDSPFGEIKVPMRNQKKETRKSRMTPVEIQTNQGKLCWVENHTFSFKNTKIARGNTEMWYTQTYTQILFLLFFVSLFYKMYKF